MLLKILLISLPLINSQLVFPGQTNADQYIFEDTPNPIANKTISEGIIRLALAINKANNNPNIIFAPFSISVILGLLLLASQGETFNELASVLGVNNQGNLQFIHETYAEILKKLQTSNFDQQVTFASGIFVQKEIGLRHTFVRKAKSWYNGEILNLDFQNPYQSKQIVDNWINERTKGKISEIVDFSLVVNAKIIIANAMYFRAQWETQFKPQSTKRKRFYIDGVKAKLFVKVDMMMVANTFPFYIDAALDCKIMAYPYKGREFIIYMVLPIQSTKAKLKALESRLDHTEIERLIQNLSPEIVQVFFPKMHLDSTINLKQTLQLLGLNSLFDPYQADLSQLTGNANHSGLFASEIVHKVAMEITETGTEAVSTTVSYFPLSKPSDFRANVPFLYFIRHEPTKTIQFWGSITIPTPNFE